MSEDVLPLKSKLKHIYNPSSFACLKIQLSNIQSDIDKHTGSSEMSLDELKATKDIYKNLYETEGCDCEPFEIDGYIYTQCPCEYQLPNLNFMIDLADQMEKGNLPHSGGVLEQLGKLYEVINLVSTYRNIYMSYEKK